MIVETYEVEEHTTEGRDTFEIEAEAQALIEELGLEGQASLSVKTDESVDTLTRIPYRLMTEEEIRVYGYLYPSQTAVVDYDSGPIPLRVLQVIAHARPLFDDLTIWSPRQQDPDPVLVGTLPVPGRTWGHRTFLLARWGDALEEFENLREKVRLAKIQDFTDKANEVIATCQTYLKNPSGAVNKWLKGANLYEPYSS